MGVHFYNKKDNQGLKTTKIFYQEDEEDVLS